MRLEWDSHKADTNLAKHGIDFADAATTLLDDFALTVVDDSVDDEERHVTLGMDALGRCLVVAYTWRDDIIRLISAREATRSERRRYEGAR